MKEYIEKIQKLRKKYSQLFGGICDYKKRGSVFINISFFGDCDEVTSDMIIFKIKEFQEEICSLDRMLKEMKKLKKHPLYALIRKNAHIFKAKLRLFQYSIYFEAQKAGNQDEFPQEQYLQSIHRLHTLFYGPRISDVSSEKEWVLSYLRFQYENFSHRLSLDHQKKMNQLFLGQYFSQKQSFSNGKSLSVFDRLVSQSSILHFFRKVLAYYEVDFQVVLNRDAKNVRVEMESKTIMFPASYVSLPLGRVLELVDHEIGVHVIRAQNTINSLGFPAEGYLGEEEGYAMYCEYQIRFSYKITHPTFHHTTLYICEQFDFEEACNIMQIYFYGLQMGETFDACCDMAIKRVLRGKSFVSHHHKQAARKDVVYTRGLQKIARKIDSLDFLDTFYLAKLPLRFKEERGYLKKQMHEKQIFPQYIGKKLAQVYAGEKKYEQLPKELQCLYQELLF